jgi:hypothetical protein
MGTLGMPSSAGGGPSIVMDTMFSPLSKTRPSTRFSSLSMAFDVLGFSFLGRDSPMFKNYSYLKNPCFVTCVNYALCSYS